MSGIALNYEPNRYVHPLRVGDVELANNLTLAPMAGFTNLAFRLIAKEVGGCGLVASEMVAALGPGGGARRDEKMRLLTETVPDEKPIAMQVYGRDPELCAQTARELEARGADLIDLNCGCPVRKAKSAGCGVALMREPEQVGRIVAAMRAATTRPLGVKMRLGFDADNRNMVEVARAAVDNGADVLAVHARTGESKHGTEVDLTGLAEVKQSVSVPVLANGSMDTAEAIRRARDVAGADGYQIGRSACGDPWLFRNLIAELTGGEVHQPTLAERRTLLERHYALIVKLFGEKRGTMIMRKYTFFYCSGLPGVRRFRGRFVEIKTADEFQQLVEEFFAPLQSRADLDAHGEKIRKESAASPN